MNLKRIILLFLVLLSVSFAGPFSVESSFSSGAMLLSTNGVFYGGNHAFDDVESYWETSLRFELMAIYEKMGIYASVDKPVGDYYFNQYFILSGGGVRRFNLSGKSVLDLHVGTTWHSIDEAIHSFMESFIYIHYVSLPGFEIGLKYQYQLFKHVSLYMLANYNYNIYEVHSAMTYNPQYYFHAFSINAGVLFSLL